MPVTVVDYPTHPPEYIAKVKAYREAHSCSLQEATRAVKKAWLRELLAEHNKHGPHSSRLLSILHVLIEEY